MRIGVHNGNFHLDDIFAIATLKLFLNSPVEIVRTRDSRVLESCDYVVDVGAEYDPSQKKFDHHQQGGAGTRDNGIPYAAFGLVWKECGSALCGSDAIAERIDTDFVQGIDAGDNGVSISENIYSDVREPGLFIIPAVMRPTWKEPEDELDSVFLQLADLATPFLRRMIKVTKDLLEAEEMVKNAYKNSDDKRLIELPIGCPFQNVLTKLPEPLFALYPDEVNNTWKVRTVIGEDGPFSNRITFPDGWRGLQDENLQEVSGVADAIFVHNGGHLAGAESKEGAFELARKTLEQIKD